VSTCVCVFTWALLDTAVGYYVMHSHFSHTHALTLTTCTHTHTHTHTGSAQLKDTAFKDLLTACQLESCDVATAHTRVVVHGNTHTQDDDVQDSWTQLFDAKPGECVHCSGWVRCSVYNVYRHRNLSIITYTFTQTHDTHFNKCAHTYVNTYTHANTLEHTRTLSRPPERRLLHCGAHRLRTCGMWGRLGLCRTH
jgi:hypothetical protein